MDLRRVLREIALAPKRFLDWVYTDPGRSRPSNAEARSELETFGAGVATRRSLDETEDELGRHQAAVHERTNRPESP